MAVLGEGRDGGGRHASVTRVGMARRPSLTGHGGTHGVKMNAGEPRGHLGLKSETGTRRETGRWAVERDAGGRGVLGADLCGRGTQVGRQRVQERSLSMGVAGGWLVRAQGGFRKVSGWVLVWGY